MIVRKLRTLSSLVKNLERLPEIERKLSALPAEIQSHSNVPSIAVVRPDDPVTKAPKQSSADPEDWAHSQEYELSFWKEQWPYRDLSLPDLQALRHKDAVWFLDRAMNFPIRSDRGFEGFSGEVLEVGSGPIGFFELVEDVNVVAQDSLMEAYAAHLPYSTMGRRGSSVYTGTPIDQMTGSFDFVLCSNVLDHTADWVAFLEACVARIKPGGSLLLVTDSRGIPAEGHTQIFTGDQLRRVLRLMGAKDFPISKTATLDGTHADYRHTVRAQF